MILIYCALLLISGLSCYAEMFLWFILLFTVCNANSVVFLSYVGFYTLSKVFLICYSLVYCLSCEVHIISISLSISV